MLRISLPYIYSLAAQLEPLNSLNDSVGKKLSQVVFTIYAAQAALAGLLHTSVFAPTLRSSVQLGNQLLTALEGQTGKSNWDETFDLADALPITSGFTQYKVALLAELGVLPSYFVTQKEGFDTLTLLDNGARLFPPSLIAKVPEASFDATEACKALAFELPTACGFHVFRATDAVLRRYYMQATGGKPPPKVRNIGVYLNAMKMADAGDPKVRAALKQMTDLHRNPLIHPEAVLTLSEAISIIGIARSAMDGMLSELPEHLPTTGASA